MRALWVPVRYPEFYLRRISYRRLSGYKNNWINGIDYIGEDLNNMIENRVLPWVQDNESASVWNNWQVSLRDFVILNPDGEYYYKINLTEFNLSIDANYENIKQLLLDARSD